MKKYKLADYARLLQNKNLLRYSRLDGFDTQIVDNLTYDSRSVSENTLFICKGAAFKEEYLHQAVRNGAIAYVSEKEYESLGEFPRIIVKDIRKAMVDLAELFNDYAWQKLNIIGFGGTKGKSTSAYYMKAVIDDYMKGIDGKESAVISSINVYDGVENRESHITTPEAVELHHHFKNAVDSDISFLQMEVSSQALKYNRVDNIEFEVGIFLNISEDHISPIEHPDFEDYFTSKLSMFAKTIHAVVNLDADYVDRILEAAKASQTITTFSTKNPDADVYGYDIRKDGLETVFKVRTARFDEEFRLSMPGLFNVENALAVIAAAEILGIPRRHIHSGLYKAKSSGRMELYASRDSELVAVVDYAHNKLSFQKLFSSMKMEYPGYRIIAIYGCPGNKAVQRRQDLGLIAGKYADKIIITAEDPGTEDLDKINGEIAETIEKTGCPYVIINDRGDAIKAAVEEAKGKTLILVTGKGNETRQKFGTEYVDCKSDVEYVKDLIRKYDKEKKN